MRTKLFLLLCSIQLVFGQIVEYETTGITPTQPQLFPQTTATGIIASPLERGGGLTATGSAANTFSAANFTGQSLAEAMIDDQYFGFSLTVSANTIFTPQSVAVTIRRSSTGPRFFQWAYRVGNNTNFAAISTPTFYDGTQTNGFALGAVSFPEIQGLVNMLPGQTLELRLYGWGATSATGIGSIGRLAGADVIVSGTLTPLGSQAIIIDKITPLPICVGGTTPSLNQFDLQTFGTFSATNFQLLLSDDSGDFSNSVTLYSGTINGTNLSLSIPIQLPNSLTTSANYKVTVAAVNPIFTTPSAPFSVINGVPAVQLLQTVPDNGQVYLEWQNPMGCIDEVLLVMATQPVSVPPTGDGSFYSANSQYGLGTSIGNAYVVFKGITNETIVTQLQNQTTYHYAIYTRLGTTWSAAEIGSVIPDIPKSGWQIEQLNTWHQIDFDQTVPFVNEGAYLGLGLNPSPQPGMLHADAWNITGFPDFPNPGFGTDVTLFSDFTRGTSQGGVSTRGLWSFEVSPNNFALGVQAITTAFNPGTITLRWENKTGVTLTDLEIAYTFYEYNDQNRSNYWQFGHGNDIQSITLISSTLMETAEVSVSAPKWEGNKIYFKISNVTIPDCEAYFFQWSSADIGGGGSRDEMAIDDIQLKVYDFTPVSRQSMPLSGDFSTLRVENDLSIAVLPNSQLTTDTLFLDGELTINADATGYGQLKHYHAFGNGQLKKEVYIPSKGGTFSGSWNYLSFPDGTPYAAIHDGTSQFNLSDPSGSPIMEWDAAVGDWVLPSGGQNGAFEAGKGYSVYVGDNANGTFTSTVPTIFTLSAPLNTQLNTTKNLDYTASPNFTSINGNQIDGWNFIGNPYLTAYDLYQSNTSSNVLASAVRRNNTNTGFETYVFTENQPASRFIAPNQAIWVRSTSPVTPTFEWQLSQRVTQQYPVRTKQEEAQHFFFEVIGPQGIPDQTRLYFRPEATRDFDTRYDGDKLPNDAGYPNLYTEIGGIPYSVNSLPPIEELTVVPLIFKCDCSGLFQLRLTETNSDVHVFIRRENDNELIPIKDENFLFSHDKAIEEQHFELVFSRQFRQDIDWSNYQAWFTDNLLHIKPLKNTNYIRYRLTDVQGRYLAAGYRQDNSSTFEIPITDLATGVYLLFVTSQEGGEAMLKIMKQ